MLDEIAFACVERTGDPGALVGIELPSGAERVAVLVRPDRRALVLGSAQRGLVVNAAACERERLEVVGRRSGGGAVLVGPGEQVWFDAYLPSSDPLYEHDVGRSVFWLGELWQQALCDVGVTDARVHTGAMQAGPYGKLVCFAGLGPGEVTHHDKKLVGISQRRDRYGAWFHTMVRTSDSAPALAAALAGDDGEETELRAYLHTVTTHLDVPGERVEAALIARVHARD